MNPSFDKISLISWLLTFDINKGVLIRTFPCICCRFGSLAPGHHSLWPKKARLPQASEQSWDMCQNRNFYLACQQCQLVPWYMEKYRIRMVWSFGILFWLKDSVSFQVLHDFYSSGSIDWYLDHAAGLSLPLWFSFSLRCYPWAEKLMKRTCSCWICTQSMMSNPMRLVEKGFHFGCSPI